MATRSASQVFTGLTDEPFFISCRKKLKARSGAQAQKIVSVDELRLEREDDAGLWTTVLDTEDFGVLGIVDDGSFEDGMIRGVLGDVTLAEYAASNANGTQSLYSDHTQKRRGQLFELTSRASISAIAFDLQKTGSPTGPVTAELFASADGSLPSGAVLGSGTVEASALSTAVGVAPALAFTEVALSSPVIVAAGWYAATARFGGGDINNRIAIGIDSSAPTHGGHGVQQALADDAWTTSTTLDRTFRITGRRIPPPSDRYRLVAECTLEYLPGFGAGGQTEGVFRRPARVIASARNPVVAGIS